MPPIVRIACWSLDRLRLSQMNLVYSCPHTLDRGCDTSHGQRCGSAVAVADPKWLVIEVEVVGVVVDIRTVLGTKAVVGSSVVLPVLLGPALMGQCVGLGIFLGAAILGFPALAGPVPTDLSRVGGAALMDSDLVREIPQLQSTDSRES